LTIRVGVLGTGTIGQHVVRALAAGSLAGVELAGLADHLAHAETMAKLADEVGCPSTLVPDQLPNLGAEVVLEAASGHAVREHAVSILEAGADLIVMSVGALADPAFRARLIAAAAGAGCRIYLPSGAIAGLDAVRAAAEAGLAEVVLTTTKPPAALRGAPYLIDNGISLEGLSEPTVVFDGDAEAAISGFPSNVNVAVALGLAAGDLARVKVRIVADPSLTTNIHSVSVSGAFGRLAVEVNNVPSPSNPGTSYLAALSALSILRRISQPLQA
jgi:aspartate dehydrogenase